VKKKGLECEKEGVVNEKKEKNGVESSEDKMTDRIKLRENRMTWDFMNNFNYLAV